MQLGLSIGNIRAKVSLYGRESFLKRVQQRYRSFLAPIRAVSNGEVLSLKVLFTPGQNHSVSRPVVAVRGNDWLIRYPGCEGYFSGQNGWVVGTVYSRENIYTFDSLLRLLWTQLLLRQGLPAGRQGGFLLHACGLGNGAGGYLFPGVSGRGKSTLARKAPPHAVLSDELVGVQMENGTVAVMGTPFWGSFHRGGPPVTAPLRGIYFLERGTTLRLRPIAPAEALRKLLKCILFFNTDDGSARRLLKWAQQCVTRTPAYRIWLTKQNTYNEIIRAINNSNDVTK